MSSAGLEIDSILDFPHPTPESDILQIVEKRLAPSAITRLTELGFTRAEIDSTVIATRTLTHRRARREKLTLEESDRVMRIVRVLAATERVYGGRERALAWLRKPKARLGGRVPISLLTSDAGSRLVEELLIQIDEGMVI
jgi:putative toxin-antitoxin system antitoxin component (TIGR02293 family)